MQATIKDPELKSRSWQLKVKLFSFYALRLNCFPVLWLTVNHTETLFYRVSPEMRTSSQFEFHLLQLQHNNELFLRCLLPLCQNESSWETIHPFMWKWVPHTSSLSCQSNSFQIKGFALKPRYETEAVDNWEMAFLNTLIAENRTSARPLLSYFLYTKIHRHSDER